VSWEDLSSYEQEFLFMFLNKDKYTFSQNGKELYKNINIDLRNLYQDVGLEKINKNPNLVS
jgi:hypothetical protein